VADLEHLLAGAQLPALPQSAIRLLELSKDPNNGPSEFAAPIEADPGLTSQVLRFVNSSYFGFSREIASVRLAITLVGVRTIKNFVLWSAVFSLMPNPKCGVFDLKNLWRDSLRRALFARALAQEMDLEDAEGPFAAALLQDLAVPLLSKELSGEYSRLIGDRQDGGRRLSDLERSHYSWTHAQAGGLIARKWNLPEEFAVLIERHTELQALLDDPASDPGALAVALSALLPASSDASWAERAAFETAYAQVARGRGPDTRTILALVDEQFTEFAPVLHLTAPSQTLVDLYDQGEMES
jgi:HD-like signal output (HDOD) protein